MSEIAEVEQAVQAKTLAEVLNQLSTLLGMRIILTEGHRRIGVTLHGRHGTVGISLKEVAQSKRYAVQISPNHRYGNKLPSFPYFIPCSQSTAVNLINKVAIAVCEAD